MFLAFKIVAFRVRAKSRYNRREDGGEVMW